jgi:cysteine synthase A
MLTLACEMRTQGDTGSIVSLLCDAGERYLPTYHDPVWVLEKIGDCSQAASRLQAQLT